MDDDLVPAPHDRAASQDLMLTQSLSASSKLLDKSNFDLTLNNYFFNFF